MTTFCQTILIGIVTLALGCAAPDGEQRSAVDRNAPADSGNEVESPNTEALSGTYRLVAVGDSALPFTMGRTGECPLVLMREQYQFEQDGRWNWSRLLEIKCRPGAGRSDSFPSTSTGTYKVRGDSVLFYSDAGVLIRRAMVDNDELHTWSDDEYHPEIKVFRRDPG